MTLAAMRCHLLAHSTFAPHSTAMIAADWWPADGDADMDAIGEFAGRACYESFHRPNAKTDTVESYLAHIVEVGHFSIFRHASATFYFTGLSRSLTHQLVVHKHLDHSQRSQRYVDESEAQTVAPPAYADHPDLIQTVLGAHERAKQDYEALVVAGHEAGMTRKEARQAARSVLPNANETRIVVTGNLQAWRQFVAARWSVHAEDEIRNLAGLILRNLRQIAPASVQDLPDEPYGTKGTWRPLNPDQLDGVRATLEARGVDAGEVQNVLDALGGR